jgi:hypothetical protein
MASKAPPSSQRAASGREYAYLGTLSSSDNVTASARRKKEGRVEVTTVSRRADEGFFASVAEATRSGEDARLREVVARRTRKEGGEATDDERFFRFTQWFGDNLSKAAELARCMRPMQPLPAHHNMPAEAQPLAAEQHYGLPPPQSQPLSSPPPQQLQPPPPQQQQQAYGGLPANLFSPGFFDTAQQQSAFSQPLPPQDMSSSSATSAMGWETVRRR